MQEACMPIQLKRVRDIIWQLLLIFRELSRWIRKDVKVEFYVEEWL